MKLSTLRSQQPDIFRGLRDLQREMRAWPMSAWPFRDTEDGEWSPSVDVFEEGGEVIVKAEVPGMAREEIKVTAEPDAVVIQGERKTESEKKEKDYYFCERSYGSFYRRVPLPASIDPGTAEATTKDGVLTVKAKRATPAPVGKEVPVS